jgi:Kef-type K+ transport system membrane component KefB
MFGSPGLSESMPPSSFSPVANASTVVEYLYIMELFAEFSLIITIALVVSIAMHLLRQPLIIGHILTGLVAGPLIIGSGELETFKLFAEIGIAILLFTVGLNLSPHTIREFGKVALVTGIGQVTLTAAAGFLIMQALGFPPIESAYVAIALAFSSTIIILKLITDKGDLDALYAKISIGFLLVQDFIAILLLFLIPLVSIEGASLSAVGTKVALGILMVATTLAFSFSVMRRLNTFFAKNIELLFLFAIAWGMGIASLFKMGGFSIETGALIAGIGLSTLPSRHEINAKLSPLRDFFIVMFFILLGAQMNLGTIAGHAWVAFILAVLVLIGNPLILMSIMGILGYKKRTSLMTGFTVAQISEFSLILMMLGVAQGHVTQDTVSLVTLVGLVTIFGSTYLFKYADAIFRALEPYLGIFERKNAQESSPERERFPVILFGCNRIGQDFIKKFQERGQRFLIVDHNPETVENLRKQGFAVEYGDARDLDFLTELGLSGVELAVSTIPDAEANLLIARTVRAQSPNALIMVVAHKVGDALGHYQEGVDYVILPHFLGGEYAAKLSIELQEDRSKVPPTREQHIEALQLRIKIGHEHPERHS